MTCAQQMDTGRDSMVKSGVRKSERLKNVKESDGAVKVNGSDNVDTLITTEQKRIWQIFRYCTSK